MNRRAVLAGTASALGFLAGCVGGPSSESSDGSVNNGSATPSLLSPHTTGTASTDTAGSMTADTRKSTAPDATESTPGETTDGPSTRTTGGCMEGFSLELRPFDPTEHATAPLDDDARAVVAEAVEGGAAKRVAYGDSPFPELTRYGKKSAESGVFVAYEGAFYEIDHAVETATVPGYEMNVEYERGQEAPADADVIGFADLPESDRTALEIAVCSGVQGKRDDSETTGEFCLPTQGLSVGGVPVPYPDGGDGSRLVGKGVRWVSWDDRVLRVELGEATEAERSTHTYTAERVAKSAAAFRTVVASRFRVRLTGLPRDERAIVKRAVRGGYDACGTITETIPALRGHLSDRNALPSASGDEWYVRFEGDDYLLTLFQWTA